MSAPGGRGEAKLSGRRSWQRVQSEHAASRALPSARAGARNGAGPHERARGIRDQIRRYRSSFVALVAMIVIAVGVGGYVLANERLSLPCGFPLIGQCPFTLKAYLQSAQALTPGQGQAVTIAGAKIGEVAGVEVREGKALVTMDLTRTYARIYSDATLLMRPKTQLQDMTVEIDPGAPPAGRLESGAVIGVSQTAPNVNFDQFLASLDAETRAYLQELLAAAGEGLRGNGARLAAALKRFSPLARNGEEITHELQRYHANIASSIHNFTLVVAALAEVEKELSELVVSANRNFRVFASKQHAVERTLQLLPSALSKTQSGLGELASAADVLGPTLAKLHPFAAALGPAERASQPFLRETTPIIAGQIRPFVRSANPFFARVKPSVGSFAQTLPGLTRGFSVLNELFDELAYNPAPGQGGFIFFGGWAAHDVNSAASSADAHGALANTLAYVNCGLLSVLEPGARTDPEAKLLIDLFNFPRFSGRPTQNEALCVKQGTEAIARAHVAVGARGEGPR